METETRVTILLTDRDVQAARVNAGLPVPLPPNTVEVIIRVVEEERPGKA